MARKKLWIQVEEELTNKEYRQRVVEIVENNLSLDERKIIDALMGMRQDGKSVETGDYCKYFAPTARDVLALLGVKEPTEREIEKLVSDINILGEKRVKIDRNTVSVLSLLGALYGQKDNKNDVMILFSYEPCYVERAWMMEREGQ